MRRGNGGGFLLGLILTIAFNLSGTVPAWIVLILHIWLGVPPMWVFWALLGIWLGIIIVRLLIIQWASTARSVPTPSNKNPYSSKVNTQGSYPYTVLNNSNNKNPYSNINNSDNKNPYSNINNSENKNLYSNSNNIKNDITEM